jgi:TonB family protein
VAADLSSVKALYAGASYDEALKELEAIDPATVDANQIHQYRALCFLALGRTGDAERSLLALVARSPLYRLDEAQVSPRLVGMFRDIRRRTLADAALERYTKAKGAYERKEYDTASGLFREVVAIVADPDASGEAATLADVKQLAEGFLVLSAAALKAAEAPPPPPELPPATPPPSTDIAQGPVPPAIYAAENPDVVAPVDIERPVPRWTPVAGQLANVPRRGVLEVVIDETGSVESARLHRPIFPTYDNLLLDAAQKWRFKPATRNGTPVKYRKVLEIVLQPASSRQDE